MSNSHQRILPLLAGILLSAIACAATPSPNLIFILCDDLGYGDIGVFFQNERAAANDRSEPSHATPRIDTMAKEGMQLLRHYSPAPVCAPSRASLLLGVHQGHANVRDNQFDKALEDNHTLATVLKQAGYATAVIGKWGLQGHGNPGNVSTWPAFPTKRGFDDYYGYVRHRDGHEHYPKEGVYKGPRELYDGEKVVTEDLDKCYTADLFTARAKHWIQHHQQARPEQPFFLYLSYDTPHAVTEIPTMAYPSGGGVNGGLQWLGTPGRMINTAGGEVDSYYHPDYAAATWDHDGDPQTGEVAWPDVFKRFATSVRRIDDGVGDLLQLLKDLDLDSSTLRTRRRTFPAWRRRQPSPATAAPVRPGGMCLVCNSINMASAESTRGVSGRPALGCVHRQVLGLSQQHADGRCSPGSGWTPPEGLNHSLAFICTNQLSLWCG